MTNFVTLSPTQSEPLDTKWYSKFEKLGAFQAYEYLDGTKEHRDAEMVKFLNGEIPNPVLDYPKINTNKLLSDEELLLEFKKDIIANETNETVKQVYEWKINEKIAELRMLKAVSKGDMKKFKKYSEFVYGKPSLEGFSHIIQILRNNVTSHISSDNPHLKKAAEDLMSLLPLHSSAITEYNLPQESDITAIRKKTLQELSKLLNFEIEIETEETVHTADSICTIFQVALNSLRSEGWSVVIDRGSKIGISVDQEYKQIKIPESRRLIFTEIQSLVVHEVGTHIKRRLNGERSRLQLLGLGLDRYEKGEEGIATMKEQVLHETIDDYAGLDGYLAISLAIGLDGKKRDFREVFEIMKKYFYLKILSSGKDAEQAMKSAQTSAWNRTVRTFRGTDCRTKGVCFTKDMIYREGNIGVWEVVKDNPKEMVRFSVGKYDPSNKRHIWILDQLGISETDLEELEK